MVCLPPGQFCPIYSVTLLPPSPSLSLPLPLPLPPSLSLSLPLLPSLLPSSSLSSQECAHFFLDCPREKIKAAMSALLVDVLLPVAAVINVEISLPVVKKLVSVLYGHCTEHAKRARHSNVGPHIIPCLTLLLPCPYRLISLWLLYYWLLVNSHSFSITGTTSWLRTCYLVSRYGPST